MNKIRFFAVLAVMGLLFIVTDGFAKSLYEIADTNRDGVVTEDELREAVNQRYKNEDANKDGVLSVEEYQSAREKNFADADTDKNGVVTVEEWAVYWCTSAKGIEKAKKPVKMNKKTSRAKLMDKNKDSKIGRDECVLFWAGRFIDLDTNQNGKLTREEYLEKMKDMAKLMDTNGDGVIVIEEYTASWLMSDMAAGKKK